MPGVSARASDCSLRRGQAGAGSLLGGAQPPWELSRALSLWAGGGKGGPGPLHVLHPEVLVNSSERCEALARPPRPGLRTPRLLWVYCLLTHRPLASGQAHLTHALPGSPSMRQGHGPLPCESPAPIWQQLRLSASVSLSHAAASLGLKPLQGLPLLCSQWVLRAVGAPPGMSPSLTYSGHRVLG